LENILFADSNIFLDAFLSRTPNDEDCKALLSLAEKGNVKIYTSSSCLLIVMYFFKKFGLSNTRIIQAVTDLLSFVSLISPPGNIFLQAIHAGFTDLEDEVQYYTALQVKGIDYFLTSNTKDYKKASVQLPVITATQFIKMYNRQ
jgi:predicted nucleic acid-binding protein